MSQPTSTVGGEYGEIRASIDVARLDRYIEERVPAVKAPVRVKQFKVSPAAMLREPRADGADHG